MKPPSIHRPARIHPEAPESEALPDTLLDPALLRALETDPQLGIPASFAARVAALAVAQAPRPQSRWTRALGPLRQLTGSHSVAGRITLASGILLLAALFAFAPGTAPTFLDLHFDIELLLLAELGGVCYVFARLSAR